MTHTTMFSMKCKASVNSIGPMFLSLAFSQLTEIFIQFDNVSTAGLLQNVLLYQSVSMSYYVMHYFPVAISLTF